MAHVLSLKEAKHTIALLDKLILKGFKLNGKPSAISEAARLLKMSRGGVSNRISTAFNLYQLQPVEVEPEEIEVIEPDAESVGQQERQRYTDTIDRLRKELRAAHRTLNEGETLRQAVFQLNNVEIATPKWALASALKKHTIQELPVLFLSDVHLGEVIVAEQVNGVNAYSVEIAQRRYKTVIERTIKLCRRSGVKHEGFLYVRGGDMISGSIHDELRKTNELTSINQCIELVEMESAGIKALADEFGKVHIVTVCGNHGREGEKVNYKGYVDANYDYATAFMLTQKFAGDKRVSFYTPKSPDALVGVYGFNIVFTHGNLIGGKGSSGQGFIGAASPISKGVYKLRQAFSNVGVYVDTVVLGHFHTSLLGGSHYIANTSLCGYGEFAQSLRAEPEAPGATLFFVDSQVGVSTRTVVYAELPTKRPSDQAKTLNQFVQAKA